MECLGIGGANRVSPVGRELELSVLERFLGSGGATRALVLFGEPGIGKTTLWEAGVELARAHGLVALCARASDAEARVPFVGLADLLDGVDPGVLAGLPAAQLHALEVALVRAEPFGAPPEPLAVLAGFLGVLRLLAGREPVVIAVDDIPSLDPASADALVFAARRLSDHRVRFLVSRRGGRQSELERVLEPGVDRLELGALSFGAVNRLLTERLGLSLPRWVLRQLFETSHGNPLFALEFGRMLVERDVPEIGAPLPVPELLEDLFGSRVAALSPAVQRVLLAVSLSAGLGRAELKAVVDPLALEDAVSAGFLVVERRRVRPSHPLIAAAAWQRSSTGERRQLHLALAGAVSDRTLRARHLALAAVAPDAELAAEVAAAAAAATERGAVQDAVQLAAHALELTQGDAIEYSDRLLALARCLVTAGDHPRATALLAAHIDALPAGRARATAHLLLGEAATQSVEEKHLERAIAESKDEPGLHADALARQALLLAVGRVAQIRDAEALARQALPAARSAGADVERRVLVALAWTRSLRGRPIDDLLRRFPPAQGWSRLFDSSIDRPAGVRLAFRGELEQARAVFRRLLALADERGEIRSGVVLHQQLCEVELRAGAVDEAARLLGEWDYWTALEEEAEPTRARVQALIAALRGVPEDVTRWATAAVEASESNPGFGWDRLEATRANGIAALFKHDAKRAAASLRVVWEHTIHEGVDDPGAFPVAGDLVEALAELDEIDASREVIDRICRLASEQRHPWGLATAKRCAAVVELAGGYRDDAAAALGEAAADYGRLGLGFDRARAFLFLGRVQRRFKKRASARRSLEHAETAFAQLGCHGWADQARFELARVSGRRAVGAGELTLTEGRVAQLAASGLSNKEIAAQLFVSVYTVEEHLSNIYAKLDIRSRTQLSGRLGRSP